MKRLWIIALLLVLLLCGCGGKTGDAQIMIGSSELYSREELLDAADSVLADFQSGFGDCKLLRVTYSEKHTLREGKYMGSAGEKEDVAVFLADFYVGKNALAVGALIPGQTCSNYQFILSRNSWGEWVVRNKGYG